MSIYQKMTQKIILVIFVMMYYMSNYHYHNCGAAAALTDGEVVETVLKVFPLADGSILSGSDEAKVEQIQPLLQRIVTTGCPPFTNSSSWSHDKSLLQACLLAVIGHFSNEVFSCFAFHTTEKRMTCF